MQISPSLAKEGQIVEVEILLQRRRAVVSTSALFDPSGERMRAYFKSFVF